jgi:carboxylesterase type B
LGAFGWLGGDSVTANGTANAALHDQRFALNWVKKNIHLFGGDSSRVTVMGESAGGGSVLHQVTAYGGQGTVPFQQAIIQSPGWIPLVTEEVQEATLQQFLGFLNVSTIEEARTLSSDKLIAANSAQIAIKSQWGQFTYGPTVDGTFAPALPGQLLLEGKFHSGVNVMVGHTADEGLLFTSPESYNSTGFASELATLIPNSPKNKFDYVEDVLYPAVYNGSYDYKDSVARSALMVSDLGFQCNTDYINHAFEKTYAYEFVISPGLHGQDGSYTFYNPGETVVSSNPDVVTAMSSVTNVSVALAMQDYFLSFTENGVPTSSLAPPIEPRGLSGQLMSINTHTIQRAQDATNNQRCKFWQTASDLFQ